MNESNTEVVSADTPVAETEITQSTIEQGSMVTPETQQAPVEEAAAAVETPAETAQSETPVPAAEPVPEVVEAPAEQAPATPAPEATAEPQKKEHKISINDNKSVAHKERRAPMSDADRRNQWTERLLGTKILKDQLTIKTVVDYAMTHRGYNEKKNWSATLIRMVEHLVYRLRNRVEVFTAGDVEHLTQKLMKFLVEKPLGLGPRAWNEDYPSNYDQRKAVDAFYGLNCRLADISQRDRLLLAFRDSAWPSKIEEEKGIGGSFAERYHYLVTCIVSLMTTSQDLIDGLFGECYHSTPTDDYAAWEAKQQERLAARYGNRPAFQKNTWYADGKCKECGSDITTDAEGHTICSNPICSHNIAPVSDAMPSTFGQRRPRGNATPADFPSNKGPRRDNRDRRHNRNDAEGDMDRVQGRQKKRGKRFRLNDGAEGAPISGGNEGAPSHYTTPGSENLGTEAFAGLTLN